VKKNYKSRFHPPLKPQSVDQKTFDGLQRASRIFAQIVSNIIIFGNNNIVLVRPFHFLTIDGMLIRGGGADFWIFWIFNPRQPAADVKFYYKTKL
jgi:hypothetical protein